MSLGGFEGFFPPGIREDARTPTQLAGGPRVSGDRRSPSLCGSSRSWRSGGFNQSAPPVRALASDGGNMFRTREDPGCRTRPEVPGDIGGAAVRLNIAAYKQWVDDIQRVLYITLPSGLTALTTGVPGGATVRASRRTSPSGLASGSKSADRTRTRTASTAIEHRHGVRESLHLRHLRRRGEERSASTPSSRFRAPRTTEPRRCGPICTRRTASGSRTPARALHPTPSCPATVC